MYESHWDKEKKQPRSKNIMAFGYVTILFPMRFQTRFLITQKYVEKKNREHETLLLIKHSPGHSLPSLKKTSDNFLLILLLEELNVREVIDILASQKSFQFDHI